MPLQIDLVDRETLLYQNDKHKKRHTRFRKDFMVDGSIIQRRILGTIRQTEWKHGSSPGASITHFAASILHTRYTRLRQRGGENVPGRAGVRAIGPPSQAIRETKDHPAGPEQNDQQDSPMKATMLGKISPGHTSVLTTTRLQ